LGPGFLDSPALFRYIPLTKSLVEHRLDCYGANATVRKSMPNLDNAKKAFRQALVRAERNANGRAKIEYIRRSFRKLLEEKKFAEAEKLMADLNQVLDKAAGKNLMKANTVDRVKSRAMKALAKAKK
jgi:ribosomal protein S20